MVCLGRELTLLRIEGPLSFVQLGQWNDEIFLESDNDNCKHELWNHDSQIVHWIQFIVCVVAVNWPLGHSGHVSSDIIRSF